MIRTVAKYSLDVRLEFPIFQLDIRNMTIHLEFQYVPLVWT